MLNAQIVRLCAQCGRNPVSTFSPTARVCDECAIAALMAAMTEAMEGFRCPRCGRLVPVLLFARMSCAACGWVEELPDD